MALILGDVSQSCAGPPGAARGMRCMAGDDGVAALVRRNLAALDGDGAQAAALLRKGVPANSLPGPGDPGLPRYDVGQLNLPEHAGRLLRVIGVARPAAGEVFAVGDAGSAQVLPVAWDGEPVTRGTPVEVVGRWDSGSKALECCSCATVGQVPDYAEACTAVEDLCAQAGLAAGPIQVRVVPSGELDPSVARARHRRRVGEWDAVLAAAELLEDALRASRLSLETLTRVHEVTVGPGTARAGQLRQGPAVIRWSGVITYRAPPVAAARSQASGYLRDLAAVLQHSSAVRHPATLAAEAVATLTSTHPFADGNGRAARAVATWLLLRSGFQRRTEGTLSTFLDAHLDEHYRALRNCQVSPWGWHQLFYDAVLATFERRPPRAAH
jgi:fido (protein-threonine AMPylation protein)